MFEQPSNRIPDTPWWHHVSIVSAYAGTYEILMPLTTAYWILNAGLRLICLLLVPRRFWAALAIGELIPTAMMAIPTGVRFGHHWVMAELICTMIFWMPIVALMQDYKPIFRRDGHIEPFRVLVVSFLCAAATSLRGSIAILAITKQDGEPIYYLTSTTIFHWTLGSYIGALAIAPAVLAMRERIVNERETITWARLMQGSLFRDVLLFQIPLTIGMILAANFLIEGYTLIGSRIALVAPIIVLGMRHGWHGAAVSGMIASIALSTTALEHRDPSLIPMETIMAITISVWLMTTRKPMSGS